MNEDQLLNQCRGAYERARWRGGIKRALLCVPLVALSFFGCGPSNLGALCGVLLLGAVITATWRGGGYARGIFAGIVAGLGAIVFPWLVLGAGLNNAGSGSWPSACAIACVAGGLVVGGAVAWWAAQQNEARRAFVISACLHAALLGGLGCAVAGVAGVLGLWLGLVVAALPVYMVASPSHSSA